ncbi:MAG: transposase [Burkholderiaceae bacterium]
MPYAPLEMFKLMLLGQWHHLSDEVLEQALKVRLDFLVFFGLDLGAALPDHSTICRFRNRLIKVKLDEPLLAELNSQLGRRGLKVTRPARPSSTRGSLKPHPARTEPSRSRATARSRSRTAPIRKRSG